MQVSVAQEITGGLSRPSKMPGQSFSLPNKACRRGRVLAKNNPNSICAACYAGTGFYGFPVVQAAMQNRLQRLESPEWVTAMVTMIGRSKVPYFRWHDSGDLQSKQHFRNILEVCRQTPNIVHWLPTKEPQTVLGVLAKETKPDNLIIRVSADSFDQEPVKHPGLLTSAAASTLDSPVLKTGHLCQATVHHTPCGDCRACWDADVVKVVYLKH